LRILFLFFLILSPLSESKLKIEITQGSETLPKIAIVPFQNEILSGRETISSLVEANMTLFGEFNSMKKTEMLSYPNSEENFFYRDWRLLEVDYVVIGRVDNTDLTNLDINYLVFDIGLKKIILKGDISGNLNELEQISKIISNRAYQSITGLDGVFNTKLAYILNPSKNSYKLYISDIDGSNEQLLFKSLSPLMSPSWSADRKKLAYVSFEKGYPEIYIQDLLSGNRSSIDTLGMSNSAPVWSSDSKYIAFVMSMSGNPDIYLYNLRNKKISRLTRHYGIDTEPAWSPNSKKLLFTSNRSGSPQIYELVVSTGRIKRVTLDGDYNARARYFPNGKDIVLVHGNDGVFHIATKNLKSRFINSISKTSLDESPTISPNGNIIIYATKKKTQGFLAGLTLNGKSKFTLPVQEGSVREPAWSPLAN
jgi:TolB protein